MGRLGLRSGTWGVAVLGLLLSVVGSAAAEVPTDAKALAEVNKGPFGYWKDVDDDTGKARSIFKLWRYKGKLVGRIEKRFSVDGEPLEKLCTECEGDQKNKPIDGIIFIWDFKFDDEEKKWIDGRILNPQDGNVYHAELTLSKDGKTLEVYGYMELLVKIGGTRQWKRPTPAEMKTLL